MNKKNARMWSRHCKGTPQLTGTHSAFSVVALLIPVRARMHKCRQASGLRTPSPLEGTVAQWAPMRNMRLCVYLISCLFTRLVLSASPVSAIPPLLPYLVILLLYTSPSSPAAHAGALLDFSTLSHRNTPSTHLRLPRPISILIISPSSSQTRARLLLSFCPRQARKALVEAAAVASAPFPLPAHSEEQQPSAQPRPQTIKERPAEVKTQRSETSASSLSRHILSFSSLYSVLSCAFAVIISCCLARIRMRGARRG